MFRRCDEIHLTVSAPTGGEFVCPDDWQRVPRAGSYGHVTWAACVRVSDEPLTWSEALDDCRRSHSAHLLILDDRFYRRYMPNDVDDRRELALKSVADELRDFAARNGLYRTKE